jgi:hypothetical protein
VTSVLAVIFVLAGIFALYSARYMSQLRAQARAWPRVPGHMTAREAVSAPLRRGVQGRSSYTPEVRYTYSVDGVEYQGDKLNLSTTTNGSRKSVERKLAKISDTPDVLYDPADPKTSCLTPPGQSDVAVFGLAGVVAIVVGIVLFVT